KRLTYGDIAIKAISEIARLIRPRVVVERGRLIGEGSGRRHQVRVPAHARIQSSGIHKRLENRPRLALRDGAIQLTQTVIATSNQRFDVTCDRHHTDHYAYV